MYHHASLLSPAHINPVGLWTFFTHTHLRGGPLLPIRNIHHHTAIRVYLGVRMGIAEHKDDNKKVFGFSLTAEDNDDIQAVLERSNGDKLIATIGDCGAEYR